MLHTNRGLEIFMQTDGATMHNRPSVSENRFTSCWTGFQVRKDPHMTSGRAGALHKNASLQDFLGMKGVVFPEIGRHGRGGSGERQMKLNYDIYQNNSFEFYAASP